MLAARRVRPAVATLVLVVALGVAAAPAALAQVGPDQPTTTEPPPTTEVPTTEAPTTEAPTTESPTSEEPATTVAPTEPADGGEGGSSIDWGTVAVIAAIAAVIAGLIALVAGAGARRRRAQATLDSRLADVVGGAEWIHDQASLELIGGTHSPERLRPAWEDTRRRIDDLGARTSVLAVDVKDQALSQQLHDVTHALGLLGGALDTSVGLRLQGGSDPGTLAAIGESYVTVNDRRHDLQRALVPLARRR